MGIVRFPNLSPRGPVGTVPERWELRANTGRFQSPLTGATRTVGRVGDRWAVTLAYRNLNSTDAARMRAFLGSMRGMTNRCYVRDFLYTQRGSFSQSQVLTEPDFDNDGAAWTFAAATFADVDVVDGWLVARARQRATDLVFAYQDGTVVAGVPYVASATVYPLGQPQALTFELRTGSPSAVAEWAALAGEQYATDLYPPHNVLASFVPDATSCRLELVYRIGTGARYGDGVAVGHASVSRCALIDIPENLLLYSEQFDNAAWAKARATISANASSFGGEAVADQIVEDGTAGNSHYARQSVAKTAAQEMVSFSVYVRQGAGDRDIQLRISNAADTDRIRADFDLSSGGVSNVLDASSVFEQPRATIEALPNIGEAGWYRCTLSGITDTDTTLLLWLFMVQPGTGVTYNGDSTSSLVLFGAQLQFSALSGHYTQSVASAVAASSASSPGGNLPLKGLPVSTDGILLPGDLVQCGPDISVMDDQHTQLARVVAPLNSDEGGRGVLSVSPILNTTPGKAGRYNDTSGGNQTGTRVEPIVRLWRPEGRFMLDDNSVSWEERHGGFVDATFTLVEDIVP